MSKLVFAAFLLLSAFNAWADQNPCQKEPTGRISCTPDGFKSLTDAIIEYHGEAVKCALHSEADRAHLAALEASLKASEAARLDAEARLAAIKPPSVLRPILAVTGAVLGAVALTSALTLDVPPQVRLGLGAGGLAGIAAGFVFVIPERIKP